MALPAQLTGLFAGTDWAYILWVVMIILGILLFMFLVVGVATVVAYYFSYPIKLKYWEVVGTGGGASGGIAVGQQRSNRVKKTKNGWKPLYPLFKRGNHMEPFADHMLYAGRTIYAIRKDDTYVPLSFNVQHAGDKLTAELNLVPKVMRNWQSMMHKQHEIEYAKNSFWNDNKAYIIMVVVGLMILASCVATVWLNYQMLMPARGDVQAFTAALQNFGTQVVSQLSAQLTVLAFMLVVTGSFFWASQRKDEYVKNVYMDLVVKRSFLVIAIYMLALTGAAVMEIADAAYMIQSVAGGTQYDLVVVHDELWLFVFILTWAGYLVMFYTFIRTIFDLLEIQKSLWEQRRGLD